MKPHAKLSLPLHCCVLTQIMEGLGPAYIKIAQQLSTRVDVIPQVYINELQRLQDNVKVFPTVEARCVLEEGLGRPVDTVFEWLSEDPIAAASLGQVRRHAGMSTGRQGLVLHSVGTVYAWHCAACMVE